MNPVVDGATLHDHIAGLEVNLVPFSNSMSISPDKMIA